MKWLSFGRLVPYLKQFDEQLLALWVGLTLSCLCLLFFTVDVARDFFESGQIMAEGWHLVLELCVVLVSIMAFFVHVTALVRLLRHHRKISAQVRLASGEFARVLEELFTSWQLTTAERDVAMLLIKGVSFKEIAASRQAREGTAKAQANAIYRKAGVTGRNELVALLLDEFLTNVSAA